nr:hypothetical protein [candidate division Zixibacteria bacterium]
MIMTMETFMDIPTLKDFCNHPDYENSLHRIEELNARERLNLNLNLFPFFEQLGTSENEESYRKIQGFINSTLAIKDENVLLPVELYVWRMSDALPDDSLRDGSLFWFELINDFFQGKGPEEMADNLAKVKDYRDKAYKYITNFGEAVRAHAAGFANPSGLRQTFAGNSDLVNDFRRFIFDKLQLRFKLKGVMNNYPDFQYMVQRLISLFYLADVQICYNLNLLEGAAPDDREYIDLEQIVYLNGCDYFITNNKKYLRLINECSFADLKGRAISLDTFMEWLKSENFNPEKKALVFVSRLDFEIEE